ncbi:unnamed protein product [Lactuca saligna]|uniref:Uncharacterized protein n=1 Tax=Lactuca saligna TaxID=75948 RepID=A0AA36DXC9_LACSI|nr:unnamed protein product [Lactuca saligna]
MATSKFHVILYVSLLFALIFTLTEADSTITEAVVGSDNCEAFRIEVDKLISKIQALESFIDKRNQELKSKDEIIAQKEKDCITSLQSESFVEIRWKEHGKSAFKSFMQKVLEKKEQARKWAGPHVETIKTKWVSLVIEQYLQPLAKNINYVYIESKDVAIQQWVRITRKINAFLQA